MAKKAAVCGMLVALAMIFSYVEALIPINFGVPGIKLGLANLVVLYGLYMMKPSEVFTVSIVRILLTGFMFGNGMSIIYSLAGGILSFAVMLPLTRMNKKPFHGPGRGGQQVSRPDLSSSTLSPIGVSAAGAVSHNIGQILVAAAVLKSAALFYYLPALILSGVVTGVLMGILIQRILKILPKVGEGS